MVLGGGPERKWGSGVWAFYAIGLLDRAFEHTDVGLLADSMLIIASAGFTSNSIKNWARCFFTVHIAHGTFLVVVCALGDAGLRIFASEYGVVGSVAEEGRTGQ